MISKITLTTILLSMFIGLVCAIFDKPKVTIAALFFAATIALAAMASTYRMADGSLIFKAPEDYAPGVET